jgi:lysozyme
MSEQHTSAAGKALVKSFEQCRLRAYPDPKSGGAPWTCGWGSTKGVTPSTVWTQAEADAHFEEDIPEAERVVKAHVTHEMTQGQFDAFVSIFQNVGPGRRRVPGDDGRDGIAFLKSGRPSTLLARFNEGDISGAESQWLLWVSPGSSVENGLRRRRQAELRLFRGEA